MHRNQGIVKAFDVDQATLVADAKIGQLVRVTEAGKITDASGQGDLLWFPLVEDVLKDTAIYAGTPTAGVSVTGVAKVLVETAAGIKVGTELGLGATKKGVAVHATGFKLGIALAAPKGNGDYIPVLLAPAPQGSNY